MGDLHKDRKTLKWILTEIGFQGLGWIFVAQVVCCKHSCEHITRAAPKVTPPIYFHGNYNRYEHNNTV